MRGTKTFLEGKRSSTLYNWWWKWKPTALPGLSCWLDDPAIPTNRIESALRISQWTDISGNGNDWPQATGADQPLRSGSVITFAPNEFLDGNANIANFSSDTQGEIFMVVRPLSTVNRRILAAAQSGITSRKLEFVQDSVTLGRMSISHNDGGGADTFRENVTNTATKIISFSSSGTAYRIETNGVDTGAMVGGSDDGNWFADFATFNTFYLGRFDGNDSFGNFEMSSMLIFNRQLMATERANMFTYLNGRFSVY